MNEISAETARRPDRLLGGTGESVGATAAGGAGAMSGTPRLTASAPPPVQMSSLRVPPRYAPQNAPENAPKSASKGAARSVSPAPALPGLSLAEVSRVGWMPSDLSPAELAAAQAPAPPPQAASTFPQAASASSQAASTQPQAASTPPQAASTFPQAASTPPAPSTMASPPRLRGDTAAQEICERLQAALFRIALAHDKAEPVLASITDRDITEFAGIGPEDPPPRPTLYFRLFPALRRLAEIAEREAVIAEAQAEEIDRQL